MYRHMILLISALLIAGCDESSGASNPTTRDSAASTSRFAENYTSTVVSEFEQYLERECFLMTRMVSPKNREEAEKLRDELNRGVTKALDDLREALTRIEPRQFSDEHEDLLDSMSGPNRSLHSGFNRWRLATDANSGTYRTMHRNACGF
jgi:hypothetical protein